MRKILIDSIAAAVIGWIVHPLSVLLGVLGMLLIVLINNSID